MIMAHIGFGYLFDHFIHAFHMPLFFFVSGYFFRMRTAKAFFWQKIKTLIIPYVIYTVIIYVIWRLVFHAPDETLGYVLLFMNDSSFVAAALWFLTALFIANSLYYLIRKWINSELIITTLVACCGVAGTLLHRVYDGTCVLAFDAGMVGADVMHLGYLSEITKTR